MKLISALASLAICATLTVPALAHGGTTKAAKVPASLLITKDSAGPIRLGMTVAQVRKALPKSKLARTTDGDGLALIEVTGGKNMEMVLYAGEEDADRPINNNAKIELIRVFGSALKTVKGVHTGMPLRDAEKSYGKVASITMSEIESREYANFTNPPPGLMFRVGLPDVGEAGKYPEGKRETRNFDPAAVITIIEIYGR